MDPSKLVAIVAAVISLAAIAIPPVADAGKKPKPAPITHDLEEIDIILEYNATDEDAEIVISMDADMPLEKLVVLSPETNCDGDHKKVLRLSSSNTRNLGIKELLVETPEPSLDEVIASYPEGEYVFSAETEDGNLARGSVVLSHDLLDAPNIVTPADESTGVGLDGIVAEWDPVDGAVAYKLELEQEDLEIVLTADLEATSTTFAFPSGWLLPDSDYAFGVAAVSADGNLTVTEIHFTTAP